MKNGNQLKIMNGLYEVSNLGNIRNEKTKRVFNKNIDYFGYCVVTLTKNKNARNYKVHRLVAQSFIPNPNNLTQINHIDGDKTNNCINNLEWVSCKENIQHAVNNNLINCEKSVEQYNKQGKLLSIWVSIIEAQRQLGIKDSNIAQVCNGKRKSAGGYIWKYYN